MFWREPDYQAKWMRAADMSMERAAYFSGKASPWLHTQLGRYWTIRSATLGPIEPDKDPLWHSALGHFQKAMDIERRWKRKKLLKEIETHVFYYYLDDDSVKTSIEQLSNPPGKK